ncbi:MAG: helix-turn-helix transcriptional regulator [Ectothiorhodospiraceae bacterium]|nr:helix-turn-helix transcriptional regulator [Ectothiorhodospiraceae bacterium]MCH8502908.1 helix-turn-helix domain-containing protein [Ectothiorhodospiraceae bacterium]
MTVQIIEKDGRPEWAVIPYDQYLVMTEALEDRADAADAAEALRAVRAGEEEVIPAAVVHRLLDENPYRPWREYRKRTLQDVADEAGISKPYLSQIETGQREPSRSIRDAIARALNVEPSDLE